MFGRVGLCDGSTRWVGTLVVRGYLDCYSGFISFAGEVVMLADCFVCLPIICFSIVSGYFSSSKGFTSILIILSTGDALSDF